MSFKSRSWFSVEHVLLALGSKQITGMRTSVHVVTSETNGSVCAWVNVCLCPRLGWLAFLWSFCRCRGLYCNFGCGDTCCHQGNVCPCGGLRLFLQNNARFQTGWQPWGFTEKQNLSLTVLSCVQICLLQKMFGASQNNTEMTGWAAKILSWTRSDTRLPCITAIFSFLNPSTKI